MTTQALKNKIKTLEKKAKKLKKEQDQGNNFNGWRDAENLLQAVSHLEKAIHLMELGNQ